MLAANNLGIYADPKSEKEIARWTADGYSFLVGFTATGSYSAEFRLYVGDEPWYVYQTSPGNRTAYIADRGTKIKAGIEVSLRVIHDDVAIQEFKGTILGGA